MIINLHAFLQLFASIILFFIFAPIVGIFGFKTDGITIISILLMLSFANSIMDIKGIKGHISFIRIWILFLISSYILWFVEFFSYSGAKEYAWVMLIVLISSTVLICFTYVMWSKKAHVKEWDLKQRNLEDFINQNKSKTLSYEEKWKYISKLIYIPSNIFFYFNSYWKSIFGNTINNVDFSNYYDRLVKEIDPNNINEKEHTQWVNQLKHDLSNNFEMTKQSLNRLLIITKEQMKYF